MLQYAGYIHGLRHMLANHANHANHSKQQPRRATVSAAKASQFADVGTGEEQWWLSSTMSC